MLAILDEGIESHLPPGEAGLRVASEFSATEERALYTVLWWVTSRRRDAGARALKELAFHADLRDRLLKMSSSAAPGTIADIDNAIFEQVLRPPPQRPKSRSISHEPFSRPGSRPQRSSKQGAVRGVVTTSLAAGKARQTRPAADRPRLVVRGEMGRLPSPVSTADGLKVREPARLEHDRSATRTSRPAGRARARRRAGRVQQGRRPTLPAALEAASSTGTTSVPIQFMIFDVLAADGESLTGVVVREAQKPARAARARWAGVDDARHV